MWISSIVKLEMLLVGHCLPRDQTVHPLRMSFSFLLSLVATKTWTMERSTTKTKLGEKKSRMKTTRYSICDEHTIISWSMPQQSCCCRFFLQKQNSFLGFLRNWDAHTSHGGLPASNDVIFVSFTAPVVFLFSLHTTLGKKLCVDFAQPQNFQGCSLLQLLLCVLLVLQGPGQVGDNDDLDRQQGWWNSTK